MSSHPGELYSEINVFILEKVEKLLIVKINNPKKKNSLNRAAYQQITRLLHIAADDDSVTVMAITGVGDFFTSGNDLSVARLEVDMDLYLQEQNIILKAMIRAFFEFPKLLVAVVNGPCIGIGMTTVALCDVVYCTDNTYFLTPFTKLGLCAEACSSYTFPLILGKSKASEILLLGEKLSATEALSYRFVSDVVKPDELNTKIWPKVLEYSRLPPGALAASKSLMFKANRQELESALQREIDELMKRLYTDEFFTAMMEFSQRKSKSKL